MGSLMSGWDSPIFESKSGNNNYKRNKSLTKEEIEAYWRLKQKTVEEHLQHITGLSDTKQHQQEFSKVNDDDDQENYCGKIYERSRSLPVDNRKEIGDETSIENLITKNGWWTKSTWAFLNEPPVPEAASNTYVSQFHVASLAPSKSHSRHGIATN